MRNLLKSKKGITKMDVAIFFVTFAILAVVAVPRYSRATKTEEAKNLIVEMNKATDAVVKNLLRTSQPKETPNELPTDEQWLEALNRHFNGSIPVNPFTKKKEITIMHQGSLNPCDCLVPRGGWVWSLTSSMEKNRPVRSRVWLNSDTVHLGEGNGESCIQP